MVYVPGDNDVINVLTFVLVYNFKFPLSALTLVTIDF